MLRVEVAKDIAERYPSFDPYAFQAMSDADRCTYGAHLLKLFPRSEGEAAAGPVDGDGPPEWLMSAAWVTVPPSRAEQLSDAAPAFVNEFDPTPTALGERDDTLRRR